MTEYEKLLRDTYPGISDENVNTILTLAKDFTMVDDETTGAIGQLTIERCGDWADGLQSNGRLRIEFLNADGLYLMSFESIEDAYVIEEVVPFHMDNGDEVWDDPIVNVTQADNSLDEILIQEDEKKAQEAKEDFNESLEAVLAVEYEKVFQNSESKEEKLVRELENGDSREIQHDLFIRSFPEMTGDLSYWEFFDETKNVSTFKFEDESAAKIEFENGNGCYLLRHQTEDMYVPMYYMVPYTQTDSGIEFPGDNAVLNLDDWAMTGIGVGIEDVLRRVKDGNLLDDPELRNNVPQFIEQLEGKSLYDNNMIRYNCDYYDLTQIVSESSNKIITIDNGVIDKYDEKLEENNPRGIVVFFENGRVLNLQFEMDENSAVISKVEAVSFVVNAEGEFVRESMLEDIKTNKIDELENIIQKTAEKELVDEEEINRIIESKQAYISGELEI